MMGVKTKMAAGLPAAFFICLVSARFRRKSILNKKAQRRTVMKQHATAPRGKSPSKSRNKKSREELNQEGRERKRQKKHRGNPSGSRSGSEQGRQNHKGPRQQADSRIGSKKPVLLTSEQNVTNRQYKPKSEKPMLTPEAELEMLETDERLDALLERLEQGQVLSDDEQSWVNEKLDRIDALMQQLGLSYDDDESDEEQTEDMMRLLKGGHH